MTNDIRRLTAIATGQLGSFTRRQARAADVSDHQLRRWVQSGVLQQIGPHAFRLVGAGSPGSAAADLRALVLDVGEPCWVSGPTAAALFGLDGFTLRPPFHLTVERDRNLRRIGHVIHSTGELPPIDRESIDDLPVTSPSRAIVDLARSESTERLTAAVDSAFRDGLSSERLLRQRVSALRSKGRFGVPVLLDVLDGRSITRGGHTWLEREFLQLVADGGLPAPLTQQVLSKAGDHLVRVDCRFPGTPVVVELLGYRWHRTKQQMARDAQRANALMLDGLLPYQFTYDQVVDAPATVIGTLTAALAARSA